MSQLLTNSITDTIAMIRGETAAPWRPMRFDTPNLNVVRLCGIETAPGHVAEDSDVAWNSIVRSWWGLGAAWGLCISGERDEVAWNLALQSGLSSADAAIPAHLEGARLQVGAPFSRLAGRLRALPFQAAMAGHPGIDETARLEPMLRAMQGRDFLLLILAKPVSRPEIEEEIRRLARDEQFLRDEHLARPGLEQDNHSEASRCLILIESASKRAHAAMQEGGWEVRTLLAAATQSDFQRAQSLLHSAYANGGGQPEPLRWQEINDPRSLTFLQTAELAALTRPPRRELPGFSVETKVRANGAAGTSQPQAIFATTAPSADSAPSVSLGRIRDDGGTSRAWLELPVSDLSRHFLIAGMTGSGKSVSCEHLLLSLWIEHRIPWLVIEPGMKTGYRRLLNSEISGDLDVWAVGVPRTRRLPLNPMAAPVGTSVAEHTGALFAVISSAFELIAPMPEILATAVEETYRRHGWPLTGRVPQGPPPLLNDLIREIDRCARTAGYGPEVAGNIRAGLLLRLQRLANGPLAPEFNSPSVFDVAALVSRPAIIELSALPDASSQALVMGLVALQLRHHWRLAGMSDALRHITVIEEAHRLLRSVPETTANSARNRATEDLANMLAELRGFGAGLVIVDQTPSALVPAVIANTGTKLIHQLDHPADRELAGRAAGLPADHVDLLGVLRPGDAILRTDRRPRPFRLRMPNPSITYGAKPAPSLPEIEEEPPAVSCPVCGDSSCQASAEGKRPDRVLPRRQALQFALVRGEDAAWQWAQRELAGSATQVQSSRAALCFLISLGQSARFSEPTLRRIREVFESRSRR